MRLKAHVEMYLIRYNRLMYVAWCSTMEANRNSTVFEWYPLPLECKYLIRHVGWRQVKKRTVEVAVTGDKCPAPPRI